MAGASASAHPTVGLLCGARLGLRSRPLAAHAAGSAAAADADSGSAGGQGWDTCSARDQQPVLAVSPCGSVASVQLIQRELGQSLLSQQRDQEKLPTSSRCSSRAGQHVAAALGPLQPAASSGVRRQHRGCGAARATHSGCGGMRQPACRDAGGFA